MKTIEVQNYINHITFVLDASLSMTPHAKELVKVADSQIAYLAQRSKDLDQETRVTVYTFNYARNINCLIYDKDVLRMPSIAGLYRTSGMTALAKATNLAIADLKLTPEKYGEHAFLIYVLTDGQENDSGLVECRVLPTNISLLPDHWTLAAFVPDQTGVFEAKKFGFPADNIAIWDATNAQGVTEVGETIRKTSETFMQNRTKGIRGSRNLFNLNPVTVKDIKSQLVALTVGSYTINPVPFDQRIDDFTKQVTGQPYLPGKSYYQLTKREEIQPQKSIAIMHKGDVYMGDAARQMLGLPSMHVKVGPGDHPDYTIFVQSTSMNRKLIQGTSLLVMR